MKKRMVAGIAFGFLVVGVAVVTAQVAQKGMGGDQVRTHALRLLEEGRGK